MNITDLKGQAESIRIPQDMKLKTQAVIAVIKRDLHYFGLEKNWLWQ